MPYRKDITLQLGLFINARVDINTAVEKEESLRTVCVGMGPASTHGATAIKQKLGCPECFNEDPSTFKKAREVGKGIFTLIEAEEVADIKKDLVGQTNKVINLSIHPASEVRKLSMQGGSVYFLTPSGPGFTQVLDLIRDTLDRRPDLTFMGLYSPAGRPNLYEVKLFGDTIVLEERARPESIKVLQQPKGEIAEVMQAQMDTLLAALVTPFTPETYADEYRARLDAALAERESTLVTTTGTSLTPVTGGIDLTAMLASSLEAAGAKKPARKRAPAKKAATKKTAAVAKTA